MVPCKVLGIVVILALIALCLTRPLSKKDERYLRKQQPKWKSPKIYKFLEGNVSKKGSIYIYNVTYLDETESNVCTVELKEKKKEDGMMDSHHKWKCNPKKGGQATPSKYAGEDYS